MHREKKWHKKQVKNEDYVITRDSNDEKSWFNSVNSFSIYLINEMYVSNSTRLNHRFCESKFATYTILYNHRDDNLYELDFFVMNDSFAREKLTFDNKNDDVKKIIDIMIDEMKRENEKRLIKYLCDSEICRECFFSSRRKRSLEKKAIVKSKRSLCLDRA